MSYQNISVALAQADIDEVKAAIATINTKLPFLVTLSAEERKKLVKLGPKSIDFVQDASAAVESFPGIVPTNFDVVEFKKDTDLFKVLSDLKLQMDSLTEKLNNTYFAVGNEAMSASLHVYKFVQAGVSYTPGLKSVADKLKVRFKQKGSKKKMEAEV